MMSTNVPINFVERGQKFGSLTVLDPEVAVISAPRKARPHGANRKERGATVRCQCGKTFTILIKNLIRPVGGTKSCRACKKEAPRSQEDILWLVHRNILKRCYNSADPQYDNYGGRGIKVAPQWRTYHIFRDDILNALGPRPEGHTLDRIDNNGNYEPGNVRWADQFTQARNTRRYHDYRVLKDYIADHYQDSPEELMGVLGITRQTVYRIWGALQKENPARFKKHKAGGKRLYTQELLREYEEMFPYANGKQLADLMGCSKHTIYKLRRSRLNG